ncbi:hypothetical protein N7509_005114 [Penicillium cosmopolitanum]|uniref:Uncharacterized protein n=1 Tax=Penicillium cosmopolitanum TaxID=1131564 RepID=A0A9W9W1Y4_9EURO|nr:uncharacterized protein N7509_005114 [Penicillium cosmopolitanum]KAJ5397001.1 hypothetical protein N7509_005114 [Penicillium cosmopolitanum]
MAAPPSTPPQSDPPTPNANDSPNSLSSAGSGSIDPTLLDEEENPLEEGIVDNIVAPSSQQHAISGPGPGYNALKTHQGQLCSGMAVGSSHTWKYEPGTWKETKEEPDRWRIDYQTKKLRARNAPKGSGAPVGTEYHWLIVGHQHVRKLDANSYETHLTGSKYKLAHKSVSSTSWSIPTVRAQRDREVELLQDAQRRVYGLPPVLASEKVQVEEHREKGQLSLDSLFKNRLPGRKRHLGL